MKEFIKHSLIGMALAFVIYFVMLNVVKDGPVVAGGKVDRENVLVVFPEQLRQ